MTTEFLPQCPDCGKSFVKGRWIPTPECFKPTEGVKIISQHCDRCDAINGALGVQNRPCCVCGKPTPRANVTHCDRCWTLEHYIRFNPDLARKIIAKLEAEARAEIAEGLPPEQVEQLRKRGVL